MTTAPHSCSIIPADMFEEIAANGTQMQRAWAREQLRISERFRGQRDLASTLAPAFTVSTAGARARERTIYDARNRNTVHGDIVRREGDRATADVAVNEAYDFSGRTWSFFNKILGRNSIDDAGMGLDSTVHYGVRYPNAFWNGMQMVYGDGDGTIFNRFTASLDVVAHELTHGVVQYEAGLVYENQPGALNEHFADVFGSLVRQWVRKQKASQADWLIGAEILLPKAGVIRTAIRSMKDPGTAYDDPLLGRDPQPGHMRDYDDTTRDNGGVHINSGIPNRAFYLAATALGGHAWEKAGPIWYETLCSRLRPTSEFDDCARQTISVAGEQFGKAVQKVVREAWAAVGIRVHASTRRPAMVA